MTLFRYLRKNSFSLPTALSLLLDTMQWRLKERVEELTLTHVQGMLSSPLCFFRRQDKSGRPVLVIQLRYFPSTFRDNSELLESIMPLVVFVLETTRKLLLDHTEQRILQGHPHPIMSDLTILIDFKNANSLPKVKLHSLFHLFEQLYYYPVLGFHSSPDFHKAAETVSRHGRNGLLAEFRLDVSRYVANDQNDFVTGSEEPCCLSQTKGTENDHR